MTDSSTGGILSPTSSPAPLLDDALADFLQVWIVGLTGITASLVRPRWQPEPPNIPDFGTTWVAFGLTGSEADTFAAERHLNQLPNGASEIRRHEEMEYLVSFYGPAAESVMHNFREGIQVSQNREYLITQNMGLVSTGQATRVPELVKERWVNRIDLPLTLRRQIIRKYAVLDLVGAGATLNNGESVINI